MYNKVVFRVILSSPSDLPNERKKATEIVNDINLLYKSKRVGLELILWEQDVSPKTDLQSGQKNVDKVLDYKNADLLIGLFHKKLGTPTLGAESGTIHEIDEALKEFKEKGSPEVKLYFKEPKLSKPSKETIDEYSRVLNIKQKYMELGGIVQEFKTTDNFAAYLRKHLLEYIKEKEEIFSQENLLCDSLTPFASFKTVTSLFANLESYLREKSKEENEECIFGFGVDLQVTLPNLEYLINSYAKGVTFKILVLSSDTDLESSEYGAGGYYDPDTLKNSIARLNKIKQFIGKNGNRIIVKSTHNIYPFHGIYMNKDLYITWLRVSEQKVLYQTEPFIKIREGVEGFLGNLMVSFESWFKYLWETSDLLFDSRD